MKLLIVLAICLFGTATANYLPHLQAATVAHPVAVNTGSSTQYRSQDNSGNYAFGYNENHSTGGTYRRESGDSLGNKAGSYGLRDSDGRVRIVNYVADGLGFRASIATNEPGTAAQPAASTSINQVHAAVLHAEPAVLAPHVVAPHNYLHAAPAIGITGPVAILPTHLHQGHPALLSASPHYGLGDAHAHAYPIRR